MAGGRSARLVIDIIVDAAKAGAGVDEVSSKFDRFESTMAGLAGPAAVVTGALVGMGAVAVSAASDAQQSMGAVESVFGSAAGAVIGYAQDAATSVGLSKTEYMELAAVAGAAFQNMGLSASDAASQTDQLIGIGADLAATFGGSTADAVNALQAAFRGEADPAEKFGLNLKQSAVNAKLAELGLDGLTGAAGEAARQQAIMALIMEGTADVQGQFAREADTLAGSQATATANFKDAAAQLGQSLLPAVTWVTNALSGLATWVSNNSTLVLVLAGVLGGLAVAVLAINAALTVYRAVQAAGTIATQAMAAVQWLWNAALAANPVVLIVIAVIAFIAAIVLLWTKCEGFRNVVLAIWNAIKAAAVTAWNAIKNAISAVISWAKGFITSAGNTIRNVWNAIKTSATNVWNAIKTKVNDVISGIKAWIEGTKNYIKMRWLLIKQSAQQAWDGVKAKVQNVIDRARGIVEGFKTAVTNVWDRIKTTGKNALGAVLSPVNSIKNAFDRVVGAVRSVIDWIGRIKMPSLPDWLPFGASAAAAAPAGLAAEPMVAARGGGSLVQAMARLRAPSLGGGSLTVINVSGTLNDADSARAVRRVLRRDSRRRTGVVIGAG